MDLTTQRLSEVAFEEKRRGYDPVEVDRFLAEVQSGVSELQDQVSRLQNRVREAESQGSQSSEAEETLRRTLVLAQRTADAAVEEAEQEAAKLREDAERDSVKLVADAEAQSSIIREMAESEARKVAESTRTPVLEEIRELEQIRNFLMDDVELLEFHLEQHRSRLSSAVESMQQMIDDPETLRVGRAPELSRANLDSGVVVTEADDQKEAVDEESGESTDGEPVGETVAPVDDVQADDAVDPGLPTEQLDAVSESSGDAFLDELRRAVSDDDEYDGSNVFFEDDEEHSPQV